MRVDLEVLYGDGDGLALVEEGLPAVTVLLHQLGGRA